jgi:hypothetical protein
MTERAIFGPHARLVLTWRLAAPQPLQHWLDDVLIDMKFRDMMADVFLTGIAESVQFRPIDAQDDSVGSEPMSGNRGIFEKVRQLVLATPELVQLFAPSDFCPWRSRFSFH